MAKAKVQKKLSDLIQWSYQALQDEVPADAVNNARKAAEAVCKTIILNHYGENNGEKIILGQEDYTGSPKSKHKELDLATLISIVTKENPATYIVIQPTRVRHQIGAYLEIIRTHGNPGSHDPNSATDTVTPKHVAVTRQALSNLLSWIFEDYLECPIPSQLIPTINSYSKLSANVPQALEDTSIQQKFSKQLRGWLDALDYEFTHHRVETGECFEWIIKEKTRRGDVLIFIYGVTSRIRAQDVQNVRDLVSYHGCDEAWIVTPSIVDKSAIQETGKDKRQFIYCYNFDELIEETIDFSNYFAWLEQEVESKNINQQYIPLGCEKSEYDPKTQRLVAKTKYEVEDGWIDGYVDSWLQDYQKEHLSVLGEFGTGKTWFTLHYAWRLLQEYKQAKQKNLPRPRIPVFIPLRDFAKAVEVESLISDFFFRKHKIEIKGVFDAFLQLNKMGKVLLIFDGFDEMADKVNKQKMIDNFWALASIIDDNSKVILTCRNEHFPQIKEGRQLLSAQLKHTTRDLTGNAPQFEILQLQQLEPTQIIQLLSFHTNQSTIDKILADPKMEDLLARPIMTELVIDALQDIEDGKPVDLSRVYLYAIRRKIERDISQERTFTSLADKLYFLCEISWQMIAEEDLSINYRKFPSIMLRLFPYLEDTELDYWRYDMHGQTLLTIDEDGEYRPAHKSFLEFFVAFKLAAQLGVLSSDFTAVARSQSHLNSELTAKNYTWNSYFRREVDANGNVIPIAPLTRFELGDFDVLTEVVGRFRLTRAVLDFLKGMVDFSDPSVQKLLLDTLGTCRQKDCAEVGYLATNIVLLITEFDLSYFKNGNLSLLCLKDFEFPRSVSTGLYRRNRPQPSRHDKVANFSGTSFEGSDLSNADFEQSMSLRQRNFRNTNFSNAKVHGFSFYTTQIDKVVLNEANKTIALTSPMELTLLNANTFHVQKRIYDRGGVWHATFSPDWKTIVHTVNGGYKFRDAKTLEQISKHEFSTQHNPNASEPDSGWSSSYHFLQNEETLIAGRVNSFIHFLDLQTKQDKTVVHCFSSVSNISVSHNEKFLVSSGFHEYILWDLTNFEKKIFHLDDDEERLCKFTAKFHPVENLFLLVDSKSNTVKSFDVSSMKFIAEIQLNLEEDRGLEGLTFATQNPNLLFVYSHSTVYIIDLLNNNIVQQINFSELDIDKMEEKRELPWRHEHIDEIVVSTDGNLLFAIVSNRHLVLVDVQSMQVKNVYSHLQDYTGANFVGATGLSKSQIDQLRKNGAWV